MALADLSMAALRGGETSRSDEQEEVGADELSGMLCVSKRELCADSWEESGKYELASSSGMMLAM